MGYKILGYVVWHGGKLYVRRKYGPMLPSRRVAAAGFVGASVILVLATSAKNS